MYWTNKHVMVCTASHCSQKGAADVINRLRREVMRLQLGATVMINNCSTIDLCDIGPNVIIYPDNVIYSSVTKDDIKDIVEHLRGGPVVERLVLDRGTPMERTRRAFYLTAFNTDGGLLADAASALADGSGFDDAWLAEQQRRGFIARKPDADGVERVLVTTKAVDRYRLREGGA